jgi:outer membrane receptor protein involved in Fe transport
MNVFVSLAQHPAVGHKSKNTMLTVFIAAMVAGSAASLGDQPATTNSPHSAATSPPEVTIPQQLAEVTVTATKRAETASRVGLTIAALSGNALEKDNVSSVEDLTRLVPGLTYTHSAYSTPVYTLRGVGYYDTSLGASPAVSVYIDQVPLAYPALTSHGVGLDMERVEVLKGPQGILFGENSTGGAINYIANKPTSKAEGGVDLSYGRFNTIDASMYVSGPISDDLTARVAVRTVHADPWQHTYFSDPGDRLGKRRELEGRILLDWQPSERLNLALNLNGWTDTGEPEAGQYFLFTQRIPGVTLPAAMYTYPYAPPDALAADWDPNNRPSTDEQMYQASLRGDLKLTDEFTLTSITAYSRYDRNDVTGDDGISLQDNELYKASGYIHDAYQELRIANSSTSRARVTLGGNYEYATVDEDNFNEFALSSAFFSVYPVNNRGFTRAEDRSLQHATTAAAFGDLEYDVAPKLTLVEGLRYTKTRHSYTGCTGDPDSDPVAGDGAFADWAMALANLVRPGLGLPALYGSGLNLPPLGPGACTIFQPAALPNGAVNPQAYESLGPFKAELDEHNLSWKTGIDFKANDDSLLYVNVTKGFKAGAFPEVSTSTTAQLVPVKQESVLAYEGGIKQKMLDRTMLLTSAVFYYDYANKQLKSGYNDLVFGTVYKLANIPKSRIYGAEMTLAWEAMRGLTLGAAVTYLGSRITQTFRGINVIGVEEDFKGSPIPFTPRWNTSASADYTLPVPGGLLFNVGANLNSNTTTQAAIGGDPQTRYVTKVPAFTTLGAHIGVSSEDDRWGIQLWGQNLTNKYYWNNVVQVYDTNVRYAAMPITYGVRFTLHFQ